MSSGQIINFIIILQALVIQNKEFQNKHPFLSKLVNSVLLKNDPQYTTPEYYDQGKRNSVSKSVSLYRRNGSARYVRFTDRSTNNSSEEHEMEAPAAKHSLLDLVTGEEGGGDEEEEKEGDKLQVLNGDSEDFEEEQFGENENKLVEKVQKEKEEEEEEEYEDYEFDFLNDDDKDNKKEKVDDISASKDKSKIEGKWPHHRLRRRKKIQNLLFLLLLLAYKLKLVAAIPFFVGVVVLLIGATTMAGFFFALFSAALGLHNTQIHH